MARRDGVAERASRRITKFFYGINAAARTFGNLALAVEFDVGRQVVGEINGFTVGFVPLQSKLISDSIKLAEVVDARIASTNMRTNKIRNSNQNQNENSKN